MLPVRRHRYQARQQRCSFFFFNDPATTEISPLSLHDALPISPPPPPSCSRYPGMGRRQYLRHRRDRKSTRLNSSHLGISYAVFCLKKQNYEDIAMMWRAGCITRTPFLRKIKGAFATNPDLSNLLLDGYFTEVIGLFFLSWRRVLAKSPFSPIPVPAV